MTDVYALFQQSFINNCNLIVENNAKKQTIWYGKAFLRYIGSSKTQSNWRLISGEELDLIPTVSYAAGVPTCLIATYLIESRGLKTGVSISAYHRHLLY